VSEAAAGPVPVELLKALAHLAEQPGPAHAALADALGLPDPPDAAGYTDLFEFQLYPYASVYLGPEGMLGGEAEGRVAGFWRAVGREAPPEPDHVSSLIGLYVALGVEEAELAAAAGEQAGATAAQVALVGRSRRALLEEHLVPWVFAFLDRVEELGGAFHAHWAVMLRETFEGEVRQGGPVTVLSAHLDGAPPLPDPREDGATSFLKAMLAPVRSGMILTRADLGRISQALELGLRAGERRYALEHLLGQDAPGVLHALADEADRQAAAHEGRVGTCGAAATFLAGRASVTAVLLRTLADEAVRSEAMWAASETPASRG
jgi:TorA maturation chaperone TorD